MARGMNRRRLLCGHYAADNGEHPTRCPTCEKGQMRDERDPYENRREREWRRAKP